MAVGERRGEVIVARNATIVLFCALMVGAAGCRSDAQSSTLRTAHNVATSASQKMVRTELFFGSHRESGLDVSEWQWRTFVREEVTPRFPAGLTILSGDGQWQDKSSQIVHERAWILLILHDATPQSDRKIEEVRQRYKAQFGQESVMRTDSPANVSF